MERPARQPAVEDGGLLGPVYDSRPTAATTLKAQVSTDLPQGGSPLVEIEVIGAGQQWAHIAAREGDAFGMQFVREPPHLFGRASFSSNRTRHAVLRVVLRNLKAHLWEVMPDGDFGVGDALDDLG